MTVTPSSAYEADHTTTAKASVAAFEVDYTVLKEISKGKLNLSDDSSNHDENADQDKDKLLAEDKGNENKTDSSGTEET